MAQDDMVVANQSFPSFRTDLNAQLAAIASNNSGSSEPTAKFANQWFYNTSTNVLSIRNESNDGYIALFSLDQSSNVASTLATTIDVADASGTNTAGTALNILGGAGTGSGAAGKIFLKTAPAGSSGSSVNSHATQMTIGGSGVGIGVETPSAQLHIQGDDTSNQVIIENTSDSADGAPDLLLKRNSTSPADNDEVGQIVFQGRNDNSQFPSLAQIRVTYLDVTDTTEDAAMQFRLMTNGSNSEVMRIQEGNLLIGTTGLPSSTNKGTAFIPASLDRTKLSMSSASTSSGVELVAFRNPNGEVGTIATNASSTSYNTSSDYRLKENITDITDGIERVKQLKPSRFNFIADADTSVDGFLAHQVSNIVPESITGEKDAVDEEGNPKYQGIDQSKLVPLLTAALQEAVAKIEALETRVAALEG